MTGSTNAYSATWFERFMRSIPQAQTDAEVAFLMRQMPLPRYTRILDLPCGEGRHTISLARHGYQVVGVDRDAQALALARQTAPTHAVFIEQDMREIEQLPGIFDAVMVLWQSFGFFDAATNRDMLRQIYDKLALHGRLILDVYHRDFFEQNQGTRTNTGNGSHPTTERKFMMGDRLVVELEYGLNGGDRFEWQLFRPEELQALAAELGFNCLLICSGFDENAPATASLPRMQLVFQKRAQA